MPMLQPYEIEAAEEILRLGIKTDLYERPEEKLAVVVLLSAYVDLKEIIEGRWDKYAKWKLDVIDSFLVPDNYLYKYWAKVLNLNGDTFISGVVDQLGISMEGLQNIRDKIKLSRKRRSSKIN